MPDSVSYVDLLMAEWGLQKRSRRLQTCMRRVLQELNSESHLVLRKNAKLQVVVIPYSRFIGYECVHAYFPVHRRRTVVRDLQIHLKPAARVLLVISEKNLAEQPVKLTEDQLRDHLGHVLLYLRSPRSPNDCTDAGREWFMSCHSQPNKAST